MEMPKRRYELYVAEDQARQARTFLRQALGVLRPENAAYSHVRMAMDLVEEQWRRARAGVEALERTGHPARTDIAVESESACAGRSVDPGPVPGAQIPELPEIGPDELAG